MNKMKLMVLALASLMGWPARGITQRRRTLLANEKSSTAPDYKALHAEAIGIPKDQAHDMSDADQLKAHQAHMAQVEKLANDDEEDDMPAGPAEEAAAANAKLEEANTKLANAEKAKTEAIANERKAHAADLIANAMAAGKVTAETKAAWEADFERDFEGAKTRLAHAKPVMKTAARTVGRGVDSQAIANEQDRRDQVHLLVNEKMTKGMTYDAAFSSVRREKPALFEAMTQPEPKK